MVNTFILSSKEWIEITLEKGNYFLLPQSQGGYFISNTPKTDVSQKDDADVHSVNGALSGILAEDTSFYLLGSKQGYQLGYSNEWTRGGFGGGKGNGAGTGGTPTNIIVEAPLEKNGNKIILNYGDGLILDPTDNRTLIVDPTKIPDVVTLKTAVEENKKGLADLKPKVEKNTQDLAGLTTKVEANEKSINALTTKVGTIDTLKLEVEGNKTEIATLKTGVQTNKDEIDKIKLLVGNTTSLADVAFVNKSNTFTETQTFNSDLVLNGKLQGNTPITTSALLKYENDLDVTTDPKNIIHYKALSDVKTELMGLITPLVGSVFFVGVIEKSKDEIEKTKSTDLLDEFVKQKTSRDKRNGDFVKTNDNYGFLFNGTNWANFGKTDISIATTTNAGLIKLGSADGEITLDSTSGVAKVIGFDKTGNFVTLDTNQTITGNKTFAGKVIVNTPNEDTEVANKKYVDDKLVAQNVTVSAPLAIDANHNITLKLKTDGGLTTDGDSLAIDTTKLDLTGAIGLDGYLKKDSTADITGVFTFKACPKSEVNATDDKDIPNFAQVKGLITAGDYTGEGAIEVTNKVIKLKVDTNSGLKIEGDTLKFEMPNGGNLPVGDFAQKSTAETITGKWSFTNVPKTTTEATDDSEIPNKKQVESMIKNGIPTAGIPGIDDIVNKAKEDVKQAVEQGKNEITQQTTTQMGALTNIVTNGTNTLTNVQKEIEKLSAEGLKNIDEKLEYGDKYLQELVATSGDNIDAYAKELFDNTADRLNKESQAKQEELIKVANDKMDEFKRIPTNREIVTFKTLNPEAGGNENPVGYQKLTVNVAGDIIRYGDLMMKGANSAEFGGNPKSKRGTRLNFPTNDIEFDKWTYCLYSAIAIPKKGQIVNLNAIGYKDENAEGVNLDNYIFVLGNNDGCQLGTGDNKRVTRAKPIKFNGSIKQVVIENWNESGERTAVQTLVLLDNGELYGAGRNDSDQFGLGNTTQYKTFTKIKDNVKEICGMCINQGSVTFVIDNDGKIWKAGSIGYDFLDTNSSWREISNTNCEKFSYMSGWNGDRGYATEIWFDKTLNKWVGRGNNNYYQRNKRGRGMQQGTLFEEYEQLNAITEPIREVVNFPLSMYAFSDLKAYSWARLQTPLASNWISNTSKDIYESELPLKNNNWRLIRNNNIYTSTDFWTCLLIYYPDEHRLFYAGSLGGYHALGLPENKAYRTWEEIYLPGKLHEESEVEIRWFTWSNYYTIGMIMEGEIYLSGAYAYQDFFEPKAVLMNKQMM